MPRLFLAAISLAFAAGIGTSPAAAADDPPLPTVATGGLSFVLDEETSREELTLPGDGTWVLTPPAGVRTATLTTRIVLSTPDGHESAEAGLPGQVALRYSCTSTASGSPSLGTGRGAFTRWDVAIVHDLLDLPEACDGLTVKPLFSGEGALPAGTEVEVASSLVAIAEDWDERCGERDTLCLRDGRFAVGLDWRDADGRRGRAAAFARSDEEGLLFFADPEMGTMQVEVRGACSGVNDHFWVFYSATSNVENQATVTDLTTGARRHYEGPPAGPPENLDKTAFPACP